MSSYERDQIEKFEKMTQDTKIQQKDQIIKKNTENGNS